MVSHVAALVTSSQVIGLHLISCSLRIDQDHYST